VVVLEPGRFRMGFADLAAPDGVEDGSGAVSRVLLVLASR
jgi:hypothetical protein